MTASPLTTFALIVGESKGERLARIVRSFDGCSLSNRRQELGELVARGVDSADEVVAIRTNCGTFSLGILASACATTSVDEARAAHPLLATPYVTGMAFAWLETIGRSWGAWRAAKPGDIVPVGALMHYGIVGRTVDHAEWLLSEPDEHGGGGRTNNAVSIGHGDPHWSLGRPLLEWMDPELMPIPTVDTQVQVSDAASGRAPA